MKPGNVMGNAGEPWEDCTDFTQFIEYLKAQMKDGVNVDRLYDAVRLKKWRKCFADASIVECRNIRVPPMIDEAISKDSPAMFEIAMTLLGKRLGRGIVRQIWVNFERGYNVLLRHLLDKRPVALCSVISQMDLFVLLCSLVQKFNGDAGRFFGGLAALRNFMKARVLSLGRWPFRGPHVLSFPYGWEFAAGIREIPSGAFKGDSCLTGVIIPNGVTKIGEKAFSRCSSLSSITIPNGVTKIGEEAFLGCRSLSSITIPSGVTEIGNCAFWGCMSLTSVTIPDSVKEIGNGAFSRCSSLSSITIPSSVTQIGEEAFLRCRSLSSITIPSGVTKIGEGVFCECTSLSSIAIPSGVTEIGNCAFWGCSSLSSVSIPNSVKEIGNGAFLGCSSLTEVIIPNSVTKIGVDAFGDTCVSVSRTSPAPYKPVW